MKGYGFLAAFIAILLLWLGSMVGLFYVVVHFIGKFW